LHIYIGLLLAVAFLGYFISTAFSGKPQINKEQLWLSDVADDKSVSNKDAAFHKKLDVMGPYPREPNKLLSKDAILKLKRAISEKAFLDFRGRRDELINERVAYMK
jgi:hypothetical protein